MVEQWHPKTHTFHLPLGFHDYHFTGYGGHDGVTCRGIAKVGED